MSSFAAAFKAFADVVALLREIWVEVQPIVKERRLRAEAETRERAARDELKGALDAIDNDTDGSGADVAVRTIANGVLPPGIDGWKAAGGDDQEWRRDTARELGIPGLKELDEVRGGDDSDLET